jgi:hypothetical protein
MSVEQWIKELKTRPGEKAEEPRDLAPKSKAHTRAVLHRLFECAMRWRYLDCQRNPMSLIELRWSSRRTRPIYLISPNELCSRSTSLSRGPPEHHFFGAQTTPHPAGLFVVYRAASDFIIAAITKLLSDHRKMPRIRAANAITLLRDIDPKWGLSLVPLLVASSELTDDSYSIG